MATTNTTEFIKKARDYGLNEFLEIMSELSQESTKNGLLSRLQKELITYGLALYKDCHRCISIHRDEATRLKATDAHFSLVKKVVLFMNAPPHGDSELWDDWVESWVDYSYSKIPQRRQLREMIALAIAIVQQHEKQIALHFTAALDAEVSIEELFEIVPLVMVMDGAPTLSQIPRLLDCYESYRQAKD